MDPAHLRWGLAAVLSGFAIFTDIRARRIPNPLILAGALVSVFVIFFVSGLGIEGVAQGRWDQGLVGAVLGGALAFTVFLFAYSFEAVGGGDVKLAGVLGLLAGWPGVLYFLANASVVGLCYAMVPMVIGFFRGESLKGRTMIYSPALCGGILLTWWGS